ncbi:MAG: DNA-directed RNA polymerase subunit omega [Pseudanabaenaceae cyanobacterium]
MIVAKSSMGRRNRTLPALEILNRMETLISGTDNRYRITMEVAKRAKQICNPPKNKENNLDEDDNLPKPVIRAIIELSDKMMQPQVIAD